MNQPENDKPPYKVLAFFRWFCHPDYREDIEGDLLEQFHGRVIRKGLRKAKFLFIKDVLLLFRPGIIRGMQSRAQQKIMNMKKVHWIKLVALNLLIVLMILSPFIPGPSNKAVKLFSVAGQLMGLMGLFLVPIGLAWTIIEIRRFEKAVDNEANHKFHYQLANTAILLIAVIFIMAVVFVPNPMPKSTFLFGLILQVAAFILARKRIKKRENTDQRVPDQGALVILASSATACIVLIYFFYLLFVFFTAGIIPAMLGIVLLPAGLFWAIRQIGKLKLPYERKFNSVPLYLVTIPLIAFLTFKFMMEPISNFSRDFAIKKSEALIASIEDHKSRTGEYPKSLQDLYAYSLKKIPKPFIMGIGDFRYNKINEYYSLSFSQWLHVGSLEEIVLYDKNNLKNSLTGEFAKYDYSFDLWRVKGAFASHDTKYDNWRYYHCD
ncbi:MAG: hypothetical protein H7122_10945 [Chitinophagaceae bacterium]|nr:hypothetical protein [Chitinophagaceae bacterium]